MVEIDGAARKVALEPRGYAVSAPSKRLAVGNRGRVLVLGGRASPPAADGTKSIASLAFINDGRVVGEERDDPIDVALGIELEVALDDLGDVVERGLLLRFAMLPAGSAEAPYAKTEKAQICLPPGHCQRQSVIGG